MSAGSGIVVTDVRVSNFRSLEDVEVSIGALTILVGANNAGKTSFLEALNAAVGAGRRPLGKEDIRLGEGEVDVPKDRKCVVDILIRPADAKGSIIDAFPAGSFWTNLWGDGISQDDDQNDFVGIRAGLTWSPSYGEYRLERHFLKEWKPFGEWLDAERKGKVSATQLDPIGFHYIDAQRDLDDDLKARASFWRRLTDELGLSEEDVKGFEEALTELNSRIVGGSEVLRHIRGNLEGLGKVIADTASAIEISPVARRLRDLARGVDVAFCAAGGQALPMARQGMGTRSLASLMVFRAYASWKAEQADREGDQVHTILGLEEPEAHLHPHAQRSLFAQIRAVPGQRIVSTHSPYFAGQARLEDLRLFIRQGGRTVVAGLDTGELKPNDRRKLEQKVVATRGDLLFARALVLFEGETEELALPLMAEAYWGATVHELGFSFVGVGGNDYFPFIWLAQGLGIPWFVISDGETKPVSDLDKCLKAAGFPTSAGCPNVFVMPNGTNFESQLIAEGFKDEVERAIEAVEAGWLDRYIRDLHGKPGKGGVIRDFTGAEGRKAAAMEILDGYKTRMAVHLAFEISSCGRFPKTVESLFEAMSLAYGLKKGDGA